MRIKLNLDVVETTGRRVLVHGAPSSGKTFLGGSHLVGAAKGLFVNTKGEDGTRSLASLGLGDIAETAESLADLREIIVEYHKVGLTHLTVDSVKFIWAFAITQVCGAGKQPPIGGKTNVWGDVHAKATEVLMGLLDLAPSVVMISPSDRSMDQVKGSTLLTPDLPGRMAAGVAGMFDAVGIMEAMVVGPKVQRSIHFEPQADAVTRLRSVTQMQAPVVVPEGSGAWAAVDKALREVGG